MAPAENETSPLLGHQPHSQNSSNDVAPTVPEAGVDKPKVKMALLFPAVAIGVSTCQRTTMCPRKLHVAKANLIMSE